MNKLSKQFTARVMRANILLRENGLADVAKFLVAAEKTARISKPTGRKRGIKTKLQGRFNANLDAERVAALELRPTIIHHEQWGYLYTGEKGGMWGDEIDEAYRFSSLEHARLRIDSVGIWASQARRHKIQFLFPDEPKGASIESEN